MTFPIFRTERLVLSDIRSTEDVAIYALFSNNNVVAYYDLEAFSSLQQARELIALFQSRFEACIGIRWAIRLADSNRLIGTCGFNSWSINMQSAVIGYDLMPDFWGFGYAAEAVRAIVQAAFSGALPCGPLHRIQADTVPGNTASETLLLRLGFKEEGIRRECGYWKNAFHDLKCFGLLRSEFTAF